MSAILLGKKIGMTQVYDNDNCLVPVTVIKAGPCPVTEILTPERNGYTAVQLGDRPQNPRRLSKSELGHLAKHDLEPVANLKEFRLADTSAYKVGDCLTVAQFKEGEKVDVVANTKGRGFQGVVKRWGFSGGPAAHGSMFHRRGGSYGMCQWPGKIYKGRKMPGRMGNASRTAQNLKVVRVVQERNLILLKGSLPGPKGGCVIIYTAKKNRKAKG